MTILSLMHFDSLAKAKPWAKASVKTLVGLVRAWGPISGHPWHYGGLIKDLSKP